MHVLNFLTEPQNTEVSVTLPKSDCTTDALTVISLAVESVLAIVISG